MMEAAKRDYQKKAQELTAKNMESTVLQKTITQLQSQVSALNLKANQRK